MGYLDRNTGLYVPDAAGGSSGGSIDLSFVTAGAGDILSGKIGADAAGAPVAGGIPLKGAATITPGTKDQTIAAGRYLTGAQTIKGDADLLPENIAVGKNIFGIAGSHKGSTEFYKCASVSTTTKTWSGYRAILNGGVYSFEKTVTSGLRYTSVAPEVNQVYSSDALVSVSSLYDGSDPSMVFYAPLSSSYEATTKQKVTPTGTITFSEQDGIPCAAFTTSKQLYYAGTDTLPSGNANRTLSFWCKASEESGNKWNYLFGYGDPNSSGADFLVSRYYNTGIGVDMYYDEATYSSTSINFTVWHHIAVTYSGETITFYVDGNYHGKVTKSVNTYQSRICVGSASSFGYNGYLASCRIYNRVLSAGEIAELASEFTPTA